MAFLGYSDDFDLDDDGILRDSASSGGILIDDDGIVRDDFDNQSKYTSRSSTTHWTDSGLGGDKQSAAGSTSTLRQFDLQSYPSLDDFSHPLNDSHTNISDLEASKDDLTFEGDFRDSFDRDFGYDNESQSPTPRKHHGKSLLDSRNSSLTFDDTEGSALRSTTDSNQKELFDTDYYKQLQELGVLVDGSELPEPEFTHTQTSLNEFEQLEDHLSRDDIEFEPDIPEEPNADPIQEFLRRTPTRNLQSPAFDRGTPTRNVQSPALERQRGTPTRNLQSPLFNKERGTQQSPALERGYGIRDQYSPYGDREFRKRQGSDVSLTEDHPHHVRPVSAGSARTISSRSFPEISPEEALQYYKDNVNYHDDLNLVDNDAASLDFESSQRTCDDDEIFIITSRISDAPKPAKLRAYEVFDRDTPMTVSSYSSRSASRTSQASNHGNEKKDSVTKGGNYMHDQSFASSLGDRSFDQDVSLPDARGYISHNQERSVTPTGPNNSHPSRHTGSRTPTNSRVSPRPESVASQRSSASEHNSSRSKIRFDQQREEDQSVSKARSQESFFEQKSPKPSDKSDKMPKRLLPKPSATEVNQSFRVKSKSTSNISTKPGPVKPKHNSVSDLSHERIYETEHDPQSEGLSATSDKSKTELSSKLNQEFHKRKQATELVQQLQKDYDKLLSKYAMAELTIDQLRLGAHVTLHTASPTPSQATSGSVQSVQQPQILHLQRGVKSPSPFQGSMGYASPLLNDSTVAEAHNERGQGARNKPSSQSEAVLPNGYNQQNAAETKEMGLSMENGAESVKIGLMFQARSLDERMESFKTLLDEEQLTHDEQEKVFEKLRTDHEKLRRDYLQSKEDYNVLKRTNANVGGDVNFDEEKELEGELFKLGMKFDEIHEKVDEEMQKKSSQRQPFQGGGRLTSDTDGSAAGSDLEGKSVDHMKPKMNSVKAGDDLLRPQDDSEFGKKLTKLHIDYNSLMDRYRRLKQMAQTPERDKEIDNLVRKLKKICNQEPEIFKMPQELQASQPLHYMSSMASDVSQTGSDLDDEMPRYEQLQEQDDAMKRRRSSASSQRPMASVQNQSFTREGSPGFNNSDSFRQRSHSQQNGVDSPRGQYRNTARDSRDSHLHDDSFRSSFSSRGNTPRGSIDRSFDRDSPNPSLPRPRRHEHPDRKSGMKKRPESGSLSSLQDSGISEHGEAIGGAVGGNLSNLPGPGKFKQMTKQRNAHDADSGFIGSMVGSEVSQLSSRQQQQQQQHQPSLRLRQPSPQDERLRSRLREAVETASVGSSRSGRPRQDERPPSRGSLRSGSRRSSRDSANMTRDYTDDSYTLTESEMSFDSQQSKSRREQTRQKARDMVSKAIQEEEEGRSHARPGQVMSRESPRPSVQQQTQEPMRTPAKTKRSKVNVSFSEEDVTPKPTPNHSFNDTRDLLSSDEETPRQIQNRLTPKPEMPRTPAVTRQQRPLTPKGAGELPRPLTPGVKEVSVRRSSLRSQGSDRSRHQEEIRPKMVDRSIGSESDDGSEAPTVATRGSQGSERFSLLKEEIGKLREEFHKANEQQRRQLLEQQHQQQLQQAQLQAPPQAPPPSQPTNQQQDDYYFDPTEDPYAFMRGPRRRANSFSGAPTREWDDWWRMPLQAQNTGEDLPLGYAAADSYATPRLRNNLEASQGADVRARPQQRVRRRYRRGQNTETQPAAGYESDQSPTRPTAATSTDEQLYNYYVPRYKRQQLANQQTATGAPVAANDYSSPQPTHRPNHYASQPNLVYTSYPAANAPVASSVYATTPQQPKPQPRQYMPSSSYSTPISAGYTSRRQWTQPQYRIPTSTTQRPYSYDDLDVQGQNPQPVAYVLADELPTAVQGHPSTEPVYGMPTSVSTEVCPLCGGVGVHTHTEHEGPPQTTPTVLYALQTPPPTVRSRPRRRSKSASRVRHYSPEGRARSKYIVREYSDNSSAESDDEMYRRRSRSVGRHRRRPGRRYRKEYEDSLNESLNLTEEIDDLTHKMIKTVKGELAKSKKKKGFGSSFW